jgi:hypothetical protein
VCNLYSITTNQAAIIALFRVINRYVGNLPPMNLRKNSERWPPPFLFSRRSRGFLKIPTTRRWRHGRFAGPLRRQRQEVNCKVNEIRDAQQLHIANRRRQFFSCCWRPKSV